MYVDCDGDAIVVKVRQTGSACHTGNRSCFFRKVVDGKLIEIPTGLAARPGILYDVYNVIVDRVKNPKEGSYTNYLFEKGLDKMLKKVGEESAEVIIASKNRVKAKFNMKRRICCIIYQSFSLKRGLHGTTYSSSFKVDINNFWKK